MNLKQRLIADWQWVLKHSWTVRLLLTSAVLDGLELILPHLTKHIQPGAFVILSFFTTVAAVIARFALQTRAGDPDGN